MKFFFSTVGRHNPVLRTPLPEHMSYPVSQRAVRGTDLDYTALLVGHGFIIDGQVFQDLVEADQEYLQPLVGSLVALREAGLLESVDMGEIIDSHRDGLLKKTDLLLERPADWLGDMQRQWNRVRPEFASFQADFGSDAMRALNLGHVGVESWLRETGHEDDDDLRERLMALMAGEPGAADRVAPNDTRGMMRFVVAEILSTDLIRHSLQQPFIDWDDAQPFFDRLYSTRWEEMSTEYEIRRQARILFDVVIPELRPDNVEKVIKFVQDDQAVASLRGEIIDTLASGQEVSHEWLALYLKAAVKSELVTEGRVRKVRWLGAAAGAVIPGAGLIKDVATEFGMTALESVTEEGIAAPLRPPRWYYALQRIGLHGDASS